MTTTIEHVKTKSGAALTVVTHANRSVALAGTLGAADAKRLASDHFSRAPGTVGAPPVFHQPGGPAGGISQYPQRVIAGSALNNNPRANVFNLVWLVNRSSTIVFDENPTRVPVGSPLPDASWTAKFLPGRVAIIATRRMYVVVAQDNQPLPPLAGSPCVDAAGNASITDANGVCIPVILGVSNQPFLTATFSNQPFLTVNPGDEIPAGWIQVQYGPRLPAPGQPGHGNGNAQVQSYRGGRTFRVDLPTHGAMWIARKYMVPVEVLNRANPQIPTRTWMGRTILDLQIGDVVNVPDYRCPAGYFFDINSAECRAYPVERASYQYMTTAPYYQQTTIVARGRAVLGGNDECSDAFGLTFPYDGNGCTSDGGNAGSCTSGSCIEFATTGVPNHTPGAIPNPNGDPCPAGTVVDPQNSQFCIYGTDAQCPQGSHFDLIGGQCCPDGQIYSTGAGACVAVAGGIQGTCLPYSPADASGYCVDVPCPPGTHRTAAGEDCLPWTEADCTSIGGEYDPSGPGGETCFAGCRSDESYNYTYHSCYCKAPNVRGADGSSCVAAPASPPTSCPQGTHLTSNGCVQNGPPPGPTPCPAGTIPNAPSIGNAPNNCVAPGKTCPGGTTPDAQGVCPPPAACSDGSAPDAQGHCAGATAGAASSSNTGLIVAGLALLGIGGVALAMNKKGGGRRSSTHSTAHRAR